MDNDSIYSSKSKLLKFLEIKENFLYSEFSIKYRSFEKLKKSGGTRIVRPPNFNLKKLQRKILHEILNKTDLLPCVYGLSKSKNILANARYHSKNSCLLALDIEDFFPSISRKRVETFFTKIGFQKENAAILTKLCTVNNELPQGAPTSPLLASLVCFKLDKEIFNYCKARKLIYTRYFDDIHISGNNITENNILQIENIILKNSFHLNSNKKYYFDKTKDKIINGILITKNGLTVPKKYQEEIHKLHEQMCLNKSSQIERTFTGKLGFYLYINKEEAKAFLKELQKNTIEL